MRLFVALVPSEEAVEHLDDFLELRRPSAPFRWAGSEQFHVTLAFLADVAMGATHAQRLGKELHVADQLRLRDVLREDLKILVGRGERPASRSWRSLSRRNGRNEGRTTCGQSQFFPVHGSAAYACHRTPATPD